MFNKIINYVGRNFGNPKGLGGKISTKIMNIINKKQYKTVLDSIGSENNDNILDIGFGNGYLINKIFKKKVPIKIYGIEISKDMLNNVKSKNKENIARGNLGLFLEDINETSFADNLFDKIYTVNTIYFWNNIDNSFSEIKSILKSDGIFINVFYTKEYLDKVLYTKHGFNKYTFEELKKITEKWMEIDRVIEIDKDKSYAIIAKNTK